MPAESGEAAPVRVLLCIPNLRTGGAERQVRLLAPLLVRRGIELSLFSRLAPADEAAMQTAGVTCIPIRAPGNHNPLLLLELARAARRRRAQVIHTWLTQMDILGGMVALATGRRWLLSERAAAGAYSGRTKDRLRARLGRRADAVIANSPSGIEAWPGHTCRLLIPNGIDHDAIRAVPAIDLQARLAPGPRPIILSAARLVAQKRPDRLLNAMAQLRHDLPGALLVLVGEGPGEAALRAQVRTLDLEDHVLFAGLQPDAWSWIKAARVFVSASAAEGHPNAVLEAAAAGIPMVLSDIQAHRDATGGGALYVDAEDPAAFAGALRSLATDPALAGTIAAAAREQVAPLTLARAADLYAGIYRKAAAGEAVASDATAG
jgi:glycosyltransferase involved in cell wall biosynthesis